MVNKPRAVDLDDRAIVLLAEERVAKCRQHQLLDELVHQPSAATVREKDV